MNLSKEQKKIVRMWLKYGVEAKYCPGGRSLSIASNREREYNPGTWDCRTCKKVFPELDYKNCPCHHLSAEEVIKRAKELIK